MPERQDLWVLDRFLTGECTPGEAERVRSWLEEDPDAAAQLEAFRVALGRRATPADWDIDRLWSRLAAATVAEAEMAVQHRLPPLLSRVESTANDAVEQMTAEQGRFDVGRALRPAVSPWLRIAAAIVLVASGVGLAARLWQSDEVKFGRASAPQAAAARVVTTQRAERADLRLPDGTHVLLAPESQLTIPADYGVTRRELSLVGEGYFEVIHDSTKPFLVHAAHGVVHDLGTRFSVRAYPGDSTVQVVVADGRVVAGLAAGALLPTGPILERGDLARLDAAGATILTRGVDTDRYQGWVRGQLYFDAVPLRELIPELQRWYDIDVELFDSAAAGRTITIVLKDQPLAQILGAIAALTDTRYEQIGRVVRFRSDHIASPRRGGS